MNIVLIGYRCSGKSTVGRRLSNLLGMEFLDIDERIERQLNRPISDIVKSHGWEYFRMIERDIIEEVSKKDNLVIAPGGGAVLLSDNVKVLKKNGFIVWLKADCDTIRKRMQLDHRTEKLRPPLTDKGALEELQEVMLYRDSFYRNASDVQIDTSYLDIDGVIKEIISIIKDQRVIPKLSDSSP
ncbi:MAG: shikimate kinase [Thermodesulfobacteriota bacterium]